MSNRAATEESLSAQPAIAYERGRQQLVQATSIDEVKDIRDKIEALRRYWAQRRDRRMEAALSAIRLRADYEIGVRSKAMDRKHGARTDRTFSGHRNKFKLATLKQAGIPFQRAAENEKLTEILTPEHVDAFCRGAVEKCVIVKSTEALLLRWKAEKDKAVFHEVRARIPPELHVGDFREKAGVIPDGSVELVFIDPPYDRESVPLYEAAAREAARILKPGGSMICYCGNLILPDVLPLMKMHLKYFWIGAHVHNGGPMSQMRQHGIANGFKPLLWFVKGHRGDRQTFVSDTVLARREKDTHPWQKALATAEHFIRGLTSENGLVVDFFAGGGTTIAAAQNLKRPWLAFEIDCNAVARIMRRLSRDEFREAAE